MIYLKKLREVNAPILFENYYKKFGSLKQDEYLINAVFYDKISYLPLIYGIPDFGAGSKATISTSIFLRKFNNLINYSLYDMEYASKNRIITHNCYELIKWWQKKYTQLTEIGKQWLFYASKTNVFDDICNIYNQFEQDCQRIKNDNKFLKSIRM